MIARSLNIFNRLAKNDSIMLFGARGVGKSALCYGFIDKQENTISIDLLERNTLRQHSDSPGLLKNIVRETMAKARSLQITTVFIDEIQRLPEMLDDVHSLLEEDFRQGTRNVRFLVTGSSARKLKQKSANLLAGRVQTLKLHPLTFEELPFIEEKALEIGLLPGFYLSENDPKPRLRAYADTYIREEVFQESIIRNSDAFSRFIDLAAQMNGEPINFSKIARAARIASSTVESYFSILVDILIARRIDVWSYSIRAQMTAQPKYYFFDCGVLNALRNELSSPLKKNSYRYGKLFETLVINNIAALNDYHELDKKLFFWRTKTGAEVDLIISRGPSDSPVAVEIKAEQTPSANDLRGLQSVKLEYPKAKLYCLCNTTSVYETNGVKVMPWRIGSIEVLKHD